MSDHITLDCFLESLQNTLDKCLHELYTARCKIRVEQEISKGVVSGKEEFSDSSKTNAASDVGSRQGGPEILPGTPREKARSTKEAEKVVLRGGRLEVTDGRP
jgi:hypothetical protein